MGTTILRENAAMCREDLGALHGMGPKALGILDDAFKERGKSFLK
ncbi:MAG: hypothetical protein WCA10_13890 [Terracidiphilus sp.]